MPRPAGTCKGCSGPPEPGKRRCKACAAEHSKGAAQLRAAKREAGECLCCPKPVALSKTVGGKRVKKPAAYCAEHLAYYAARNSG